jgi:tetratricopeptide (TPR) repeat protein
VIGAYAFGKKLFKARQGVVLACLATVSVAGFFTFLTIQRNRDYRSDLAIWQDIVAKRPQNARGRNNLGVALMVRGWLPEAMDQYRQALRFQPDYAEAHNNFGNALERADKLEEAVRIKPDFAEAHGNLGIALEEAGKMPEAISHFEDALRIQPDYAEAHYALGLALDTAGREPEAMATMSRPCGSGPTLPTRTTISGSPWRKQAGSRRRSGIGSKRWRIKPDFTQAQSNLDRVRAAP